MGREWYNEGRSICSSKSKSKSNEPNGCITALSHFFHFQHFYFPSRHCHTQPSIDSHSRYPKGLVAPRNSLELTEESPLSTNYKEKESLNISVGRTRSKLRALLIDTSSDFCNSPRTKTPKVVARLMGLDHLPDNLDLNRSSRNSVKGRRLSGSRSLPESPRVSSARKSDSGIRRLSLQLNRENKHEEFGRWRQKELKQDEESPSPRHNGREIKERVISKRVGKDTTNLLENTRAGAAAQNQIEHRRFSQKQNTTSSKPTFVFTQNQTSQVSSSLTKVTLLKDSKEKLKIVNEQTLIPINGWKKANIESKSSPNRNKQRKDLISISTHSKSDCCNLLEKKKCKKNSVAASSAFSATERPRKQMKRAEEPKRNPGATICSGQLHQEPPRKKLEEERVVAEIERQIVDALVIETVKTMSFARSNALHSKTASAFYPNH
ncbi:hypothetical protein V5N11_015115 [Cardamine amara subsp. amara]|uniref:DUF3741 domain-containing protein n=1 Tax=Cardamine amara subsp. amara TaxID=228776 RepID=A0ABD1AMX9_CARAN